MRFFDFLREKEENEVIEEEEWIWHDQPFFDNIKKQCKVEGKGLLFTCPVCDHQFYMSSWDRFGFDVTPSIFHDQYVCFSCGSIEDEIDAVEKAKKRAKLKRKIIRMRKKVKIVTEDNEKEVSK